MQRRTRRHVLRSHARTVGREPRPHAAGRARRRAARSTRRTRSRPRPTRRSSTRSRHSPGPRCSQRSAHRRRRRGRGRSAPISSTSSGCTADGWLAMFDLALAERSPFPRRSLRRAVATDHRRGRADRARDRRRDRRRRSARPGGTSPLVTTSRTTSAKRRIGSSWRSAPSRSAVALGVKILAGAVGAAHQHPRVGDDLAHRVGADHREARRGPTHSRQSCCRC